MNCSDEEMVTELVYGGYSINKIQVTRLRKDIGLLRRMAIFEKQQRDQQLFQVLQEELDDGRIEGYGQRLLHDHFRKNGQLVTRYLILPLFDCFLLL